MHCFYDISINFFLYSEIYKLSIEDITISKLYNFIFIFNSKHNDSQFLYSSSKSQTLSEGVNKKSRIKEQINKRMKDILIIFWQNYKYNALFFFKCPFELSNNIWGWNCNTKHRKIKEKQRDLLATLKEWFFHFKPNPNSQRSLFDYKSGNNFIYNISLMNSKENSR